MMIDLPMKTYSTGKQVVNWVMVNGSYNFGESIVEVIANKMVEKIAKVSGNKRKERRLTVRLNGFEDEYECGTESFRKGSFLKNLIKKSIHRIIENMSKPSSLLPIIYEPIQKDFLGIVIPESEERMFDEIEYFESIKDVRSWFKKYAKYFHPDFLGRELFPYEEVIFNELVRCRNVGLEMFRQFAEVFGE